MDDGRVFSVRVLFVFSPGVSSFDDVPGSSHGFLMGAQSGSRLTEIFQPSDSVGKKNNTNSSRDWRE
jgi:hypothetical protein